MKNSKGFTLIELMMAVLIVGILAAVVAKQSIQGIKSRAIASEAVGMLGAVEAACRTFFLEYGQAPKKLADLENAGLVQLSSLDGTFFSTADINTLVGEESIPIGNRGLQTGCGEVRGITICKIESGGYSVSGTYEP